MNIQHSTRSDSWMTPENYIESIRKTLGDITLDPCSSEIANRVVAATIFFTKEQNGLERFWAGSIYCNPPGGRLDGKSLPNLFWRKLLETKYNSGKLGHAIFMAFSVEQLQSSQGKGVPSMGEFVLCIPAKRIAFIAETGEALTSPSHSNAIIYVPGTIDRSYAFAEEFSKYGIILRRY